MSAEGGRTRDIGNEIVVRDDFPNDNVGYPSSVLVEPGLVFIAYYGEDEGVTGIEGSFVTVWSGIRLNGEATSQAASLVAQQWHCGGRVEPRAGPAGFRDELGGPPRGVRLRRPKLQVPTTPGTESRGARRTYWSPHNSLNQVAGMANARLEDLALVTLARGRLAELARELGWVCRPITSAGFKAWQE